MHTSRAARALPGVAAAAALVASSACVDIIQAAQFVDRQEKTFRVTGKPDVTLSTFDGSIEVRTTERPEVSVTIEKHGVSKDATDRIEVRAEQDGNRIVVEVRWPKGTMMGLAWHTSASAKLIVAVPATTDLHARSGDGSIEVERIAGAIELRSGDGSIHGSGLSGDIKVQTGDGGIKLEGVAGTVNVNTGDGSVSIAGRLTGVRARSGDGSMAIHAGPGSTTDGDWTISTGDGSVELALPDGFGGELDAHTGDGTVTLRDLTLSNVTGTMGRQTLRGRLGSGGRAVSVRTGDGSITVKASPRAEKS
jgi:DUF4097 and DUF4098 domain-containing protein YvlB